MERRLECISWASVVWQVGLGLPPVPMRSCASCDLNCPLMVSFAAVVVKPEFRPYGGILPIDTARETE